MEWPAHLPIVGGGGVSFTALIDDVRSKDKKTRIYWISKVGEVKSAINNRLSEVSIKC